MRHDLTGFDQERHDLTEISCFLAPAGHHARQEFAQLLPRAGRLSGVNHRDAKAARPPSGEAVISETDPTFKRVENAYYAPDPAKALLSFDAYEEEFPGKHTERIAQYR